MADDNQHYSSYNGMLFDAARANLLLVPEGMEGNAVLPESVATVPAYAFSRCTKLSAISLSGSTGDSAFSIQDGILYSADGAQLLAAPAGIGATVAIAPTCTHIVQGAFWGNLDLKTIVANGTVESIAVAADAAASGENGEDADGADPELGAFSPDAIGSATVVLNVPEGERDAAQAAWAEAGFQNFAEPPAPGTSIEPAEGSGFAFDLLDDYTLAVRWYGDDAAPEKLDIPVFGIIGGIEYKVSAIADGGFAGQEAIQQVQLPAGMTTIGVGAFEGATSLNTISIPGSVATIGAKAFSGCEQLVALQMAEGLASIGDAAFEGIAQKAVVLPASVKAVGDYAFANSPNLEMLVALGSVEEAGPNAFAGTAGLNLYVPYREDEAYAWSAGLPASGNHLMPYGVKAAADTINVNVGEQADLFEGGYLKAPEGFEVSYAYKAKPISIADNGTIEGKEDGSSNVEVELTLDVPCQVVSGIVSTDARLTQAAYDPSSTPTVQAADIVESVQPVTVKAAATVLSVEPRATTGKTISFRVGPISDTGSSYELAADQLREQHAPSLTFTGVTSLDIPNREDSTKGFVVSINADAKANGYTLYSNGSSTIDIHLYGRSVYGLTYGWGYDPNRPYETGFYAGIDSINDVPDSATLWLTVKGNEGHSLTLKSGNEELVYRSDSYSGHINSGQNKTFYDVREYRVDESARTLTFSGKLSSTGTKQDFSVYYSDNTYARGFRLDSHLADSKPLSTSTLKGWYTLSDDVVIKTVESYWSEVQHNTLRVWINGFDAHWSNSDGSSQDYGSGTRINVSGVASVSVSGTQLSFVRYTNSTSTIKTTITPLTPPSGLLGWAVLDESSSYPSVYHRLDGTYYLPNREYITIKSICSNPFTTDGPKTGNSVLTGGGGSQFNEYVNDQVISGVNGAFYAQVSSIRVLQDGGVEFVSSGTETLGARFSRIFKPKAGIGFIGYTANDSGGGHPDTLLCPGESYIVVGNSVRLAPVMNSITVNLSDQLHQLPSWVTSAASVAPSSVNATYGQSLQSLTSIPKVKGGYTFGGYYDGKTECYTASGTGRVFYDTVGGGSKTLSARWNPNSITVTFNGNDHTSGSMADQTIKLTDLSKCLTANSFTRTGYSFKGWATTKEKADSGVIEYEDGADMDSYLRGSTSATNKSTFYAVWRDGNEQSVNIYANYGLICEWEDLDDAVLRPAPGMPAQVSDVSRVWWAKEGGKDYLEIQRRIDGDSSPLTTTRILLDNDYQEISAVNQGTNSSFVKVTEPANGGKTEILSNNIYLQASSHPILFYSYYDDQPDFACSINGYKDRMGTIAWQSSGTGNYAVPYVAAKKVTASDSRYLQANGNVFTSFCSAASNNGAVGVDVYNWRSSGLTLAGFYTDRNGTRLGGSGLSASTKMNIIYVKFDYPVQNIALDASGGSFEVAITESNASANGSHQVGEIIAADVSSFIIDGCNSGTITNGTVQYWRNGYLYSVTAAKVGYVPAGWTGSTVLGATESANLASNTSYQIVWNAAEVDVTVNNYLQNADDNEYTLDTPRTVKCLTGQSVSSDTFGTVSNYTLNTLKSDSPKVVAGDGSTVFNIYWDRERYELTYRYSGDIPEGAPELPATVEVRHGATVTLPEVSSIGTCVFKGWSINDSTELIADATFIMPVRKAGTTVTGVWEYNDKYTVVYDKGFEGDEQTGPVDSTVYRVGDTVTLAQNNPPAAGFIRDGYIFLGWSTTAGHTNTGFRPGQQVALDNWIQNGVVTLYAVWGPQVNVSSPITPSVKLMVRPTSDGATSGTLSESLAASANVFTSQTPEDVLVSSMQCEPISGENGTGKVFVHENLWQFINVKLNGGGSAVAELPLNAETSLRRFSMDDDDKFIIPSGGTLPLSVDLAVPEYVQVAIVDDEVEVARLAFTFQLAKPTA